MGFLDAFAVIQLHVSTGVLCPGTVWLWAKAPRGVGLLMQLSNEPWMG